MNRATLDAHGATFTEECVKVGPERLACRSGAYLEFPVFQRLRPLSVDDVGDPNNSSISRGAFRFESNPSVFRASFTLSIRDWVAACGVDTTYLAVRRRAVIAKPVRGTVAGVRGWVVKIPLQAPRVYRHRGAAKQARAYWQVAVHDGRLDRHEWRLYVQNAVEHLVRRAAGEGVVAR